MLLYYHTGIDLNTRYRVWYWPNSWSVEQSFSNVLSFMLHDILCRYVHALCSRIYFTWIWINIHTEFTVYANELNGFTRPLLKYFRFWSFCFLFQTKESRRVTHFQFVSWPDYGVPHSADAFLKFMFHVREQQAERTSELGVKWSGHPGGPPIVVHCSAGIGRTG